MKPMRILAIVAIVVAAAALLLGPGSSSDVTLPRADRVLVISIPTLTWDRVAAEEPPNLVELFGRSAVASASVRTIGAKTDAGEGYATIGAGNRSAVPPEFAGLAYPPDATVEDELVAEVYERRFGVPADDAAVVHIGAAAIQRRNDDLLYDSEVGTLGAALREAGRAAAVVANADLEPDPPISERHREAVLAVMDDAGQVPRGRVDAGLLDPEAETASGLALDGDAVLEAAAEAWEDSDVVLVELSDLLRAEAVEEVVTPEVSDAAQADALRRTDDLVGGLLEDVDPARDLVIVTTPVAPAGRDQLVVTAIAGPGLDPGLARSGTARRDGYVTMPDIGPTVLHALGIDKPGPMNGAPIGSAGGGPPDSGTFASLGDANERALFRNDLSGPLTVIFIVSQVLTYCLAAYALTNQRRPWCRAAAFLLLAGMAIPFTSFLAGMFPYWRLGLGGAVPAIIAGAAVLAAVVRLVVNRGRDTTAAGIHARAVLAPLVVTGATAVLLVADIVLGGPLQIDTAFGYGGGAIVAGRLAGYGNLAWALMVSSLIVAVTASWGRWQLARGAPEPQERRFALALVTGVFVLAVLAVGLPSLGANVGGTLSVVSGLAVVVLTLAGIRLDLRRLIGIGVLTVGVLAVFAAIDLSRDPADQTHLGRLVDRTLGDEGFSGFATVIERKLNANLNILLSSVWSLIIPAALAFLAFLIWRPPRFLRTLFRHVPGMRACVIGVLATGVIGGVVNDSGIAIPAVMLTVLLPHVAYVITETHAEGGDAAPAVARPDP